MSLHLLIAFHGTLGPLPFAPSVAVPLTQEQGDAARAFISTLDEFDTTPGDGSFEVHSSGSMRVPFLGGVPFSGVQSLSVVGTDDPVKALATVAAIPSPDANLTAAG